MFNVGDMIVGNEGNGFSLASNKALLKVKSVKNDTMTCELVKHLEKRYEKVQGQDIEDLMQCDFHTATVDEMVLFAPKKKATKEKPVTNLKFRNKLEINEYADGRIESSFNNLYTMVAESDADRIKGCKHLIELMKGETKDAVMKTDLGALVEQDPELKVFEGLLGSKAIKDALGKMIKFFKEFQFTPSFRMVNTLSYKCAESVDAGKEYISNYFKIAGSSKADAVVEKMKSPEFGEIISKIALRTPSNRINSRLKVYYGAQGTGKTTLAMEESDGRCTLCNSGILPADLLEDFNFNDGKPGFQGSLLKECLTEGKTLVMDEFNLLPFETIRFLQGILDGKKQFVYKGETVQVADGFNIIATMNLTVGGMVFGLPEPLVDRCSDIQEFVLTADNLMSALS